MTKFALDTNAFLRLFLNDIPTQADIVEELLKQAKEDKVTLLIPQIIIFEIAFALDKFYHFSRSEIIEKLKSILSASYLKIQNRNIFKKSLELFATQNISLADCFLICFAKEKEIEVFTFDRKIKKLGKNV